MIQDITIWYGFFYEMKGGILLAETLMIDKVINNNLVRSHKDGREVLVMGKGLGFKK